MRELREVNSNNTIEDTDAEDDADRKEEDEYEKAVRMKKESRLYWVQACYIAVGAIFGTLGRMILAQIFGEECANPGTVGWLSSGAPLCVTAEGDTVQEGGVLFADLPANMLGSFLMGLFQDSKILGLAVPMALAWLPPSHPFQQMKIFHKAFTTGFCGSLTTFSSYNSAMIVLIYGTGSSLPTQIWLAAFGYVIGMETAIGSFVCGKSLARYLHRKINPVLAAEAAAVRVKHEEGVYIHWQLPDFERRYLSNLDMGEDYVELLPMDRIDALERWRISTINERRVRHPLLPALLEIEVAALVHECPIPEEALSVAKVQGWDMDSLKDWLEHRTHHTMLHLPSTRTFSSASPEKSRWFTLPVAAFIAWSFIFALITCLITLYSDEDAVVTYRTMAYALLLAPFGALLRWKLSEWNGCLPHYTWFPYGTFLANNLGCVVSIVAVATEYHLESRYFGEGFFWSIGSIRAIRIGFAGCLTTVSTFVAEIHAFQHFHTDYAYPYILSTLGTACVISTIIYGIIVHAL